MLAAAGASSASVNAGSRVSLGGRGFVAQWRGSDPVVRPMDSRQGNLRAAPLARTKLAPPDDVTVKAAGTGTVSAPETAVAASTKRREVQDYEIRPGDTLSGIADHFNVSVDTLVWANDLRVAAFLQPGDMLKVPPIDGLLYQIKQGDSLAWVAAYHNVDIEAITGYSENDLADPNRLALGKVLVIPGAKKPAAPAPIMQASVRTLPAPSPAPAPEPPKIIAPSSGLVWPTYGPIFTYFSGYHPGLDISPPYGTPVVATAVGVVTKVNWWNYSYGYHVIMDHGNGVGALYGHLSQILVSEGESVAQGQIIGRVGSTGRSTGPHLHFEVTRNGNSVDPLSLLPR